MFVLLAAAADKFFLRGCLWKQVLPVCLARGGCAKAFER